MIQTVEKHDIELMKAFQKLNEAYAVWLSKKLNFEIKKEEKNAK